MNAVANNYVSVNATSKQFLIPEATLRRCIKKHSDENFPKNAGRFKPTFTEEQLLELKNYIIEVDQRAFGLTKQQFSSIVFDYAEFFGIDHRFNLNKKRAGREFCQNFIQKFNFFLRVPESTSVARLMAFNKDNIGMFFNTLKNLKLKYNYTNSNIYNCVIRKL